MELKANAYYKTRDGRKAFVAAIVPPNPFGGRRESFCVHGYCGPNHPAAWNLEGGFYLYKQEHGLDLVAEWREPRTKEVWVGAYAGVSGLICIIDKTAEVVRERIGSDILALKRVTLTEGEFDA